MPIGEVISYRDAMKLFNEETFGKSLWGIPRKGYAGYNAVQHIRKGEPHKNFSTIAELKQQEEPISVPTKKQQEKAKAKAEEEEKAKKKADAKAKKDKRKLKKLEKEKAQLEQVVTELQQVIVEEAPQIALQVAEIVDKVDIPVIELSTTIPDNTFFKNVMDGQTEKNILSDKNIEMPPASLTPSPRPTESGLKTTVVDNVEQMSGTNPDVYSPENNGRMMIEKIKRRSAEHLAKQSDKKVKVPLILLRHHNTKEENEVLSDLVGWTNPSWGGRATPEEKEKGNAEWSKIHNRPAKTKTESYDEYYAKHDLTDFVKQFKEFIQYKTIDASTPYMFKKSIEGWGGSYYFYDPVSNSIKEYTDKSKVKFSTQNIKAPAPAPEPVVVTPNVTMPVFAPDSTWIPKDYEFYEQLKANLKLQKRDYRFRPYPVSEYPMYLAKIEELSKKSFEIDSEVSDASNKMYKQKAGTPEYETAKETVMSLRTRQRNIQQDLSFYRRKKVAMETWSSKNQIIYEFSYDGYNPQKIIDKLPEGKIAKQLAWIINERSNMMKEVNKSRGNPIRTVTFDLVLNDKDNVFVQCSWDITRETQSIQGYYSEETHSHFLEEYKLSDASEVPNKFQSAETISRLKTKEQQEKDKAEAKVNNGYGKAEINGHPISFKGRTNTGDYKSGKYDDLYVTNDAKKINDTTIVEEVPSESGYGKKTVWKNDDVKGKIGYDGGVIIKVNRIDTVEKKFYYNILGYALSSGYNTPHEFLPYQDTKEREARTTTKQGSVNIPFEKLDISWKVPAIEQKKVEVVTRPEGDDGRHHFQKDGFNASSSNDTKASMKNATYDDFVYMYFYKHNIGKEDANHDPIITGFLKEDYEMISKPRKVMVNDWRTGKPVEEIQEDHFSMVVKWIDKTKGQGEIVGYFIDKYDDSGHKPKPKVVKTPKKYLVQFPFKKSKKKFDGYEAMKVDAFDMTGLM